MKLSLFVTTLVSNKAKDRQHFIFKNESNSIYAQ